MIRILGPLVLSGMAAYGGLPLSFEANRGQADPAALFLTRGLALTSTGAVLRLPDGTLRMKLTGARRLPEVSGVEELPGKVNYFLGADPKQWRTGIPTFAKVRYRDVYPGVDLVFYGQGNRLEYDFIVAPGADAAAIRLAFEGADSLHVDAAGDLQLRTGKSEVRMRKPVVYQGSRKLDGEYTVTGPRQIAFRVDAYDPSQPLVIDPVLDYSSYLGGSGGESANAMALDSTGSVYLTGLAASDAGFPILNPLPGSSGWQGAFVTKLNAQGSGLVYSTYLGSVDKRYSSQAFGIAVDSAGNAYITGTTWAGDFPMRNPIQKNNSGNGDLFVTKLNATGSALVYSTYLGGAGYDSANAIAVDSAGSAYVAGVIDPNPSGGYVFSDRSDAFVAKLNPAGSALDYSIHLGGSLWDRALGIAVDAQGNAYVTGDTSSPNFPTLNAVQPFASLASAYRSSDGGKTWDRSDSGLATDVFFVTIDPRNPSTIYAAGERGIFKSLDGGDTWRGINSGISPNNVLISSLTIDPNSPSTSYAITSAGGLLDPPAALYKSTNGGDTWREIPLDATLIMFRPAPVIVDPANSSVLYTSLPTGVIKSTDGGASWKSSGPAALQMAIDNQNPSTLYAARSWPAFGIIKTIDGGDNWTALDNGPAEAFGVATDPARSGVVYASTQAAMWRSADGGATWRSVLAVSGLPIFGGDSLYVAAYDGIYASDDGGESWQLSGITTPFGPRGFTIDPSRPGRLFTGGGGYYDGFLTKLNPGGRVVYSTYLGGPGTDAGRAVAVDAAGAAYVTGSMGSDAFVSKVSADGLELVYTRVLGGGGSDVGKAIAVDSAGGVVVAGSTDSGDFPTRDALQADLAGGAIIKSADGGAHWTPAGSGLSGALAVAPVKKTSLVYAAGWSGVFRSDDGGGSWKPTTLQGKNLGLLLVDPKTPSIVYAAAGSAGGDWGPAGSPGIYRTSDGGATWSVMNTGLSNLDVRTLAIDPETPSTLYAGTSGGMFKSLDSGGSWSAIQLDVRTVHSVAVDPTQPVVVYALASTAAGSDASVYGSANGGATWKMLSGGLFDPGLFHRYQPNALLVDPLTSSTLYAVSDEEIAKSTDSGITWSPVQGDTNQCAPHTLALDGEMLYAGGQRNGESCLLRSSDGGATWSEAGNAAGLNALALAAGSGELYATVQPASDAFAARLNADGSIAWSTYLGGGRSESANAITLDRSGNIWLAGTTTSADFPTAAPLQPRFGGTDIPWAGGDAFAVRLADR